MISVRAYVGVTDTRWHEYLSARPDLDEVNFWRPSGAGFRALRTGEPFLFKSRFPDNKVVGGGFYSGFAELRISEAWDFYGERNGTPSRAAMLQAIERYRRSSTGLDTRIGCVLLRDVQFFGHADALRAPTDFAKNLVQGRTYEVDDLPADHEVFRAFYQLQEQGVYRLDPDRVDGPVFGEESRTAARLGQRAFRAMVTATYDRRCAITGGRIRPVLQAAHILPVEVGGENRLDNGLLLRSDTHTLFDQGYLGLDNAHRLRVSKRLREDFDNGDEFYSRHGPRSFQDHDTSLRILKGRSLARSAQRVVSVMSRRPVSRMAPTARLRRAAMTRGPDRVRALEWSSR